MGGRERPTQVSGGPFIPERTSCSADGPRRARASPRSPGKRPSSAEPEDAPGRGGPPSDHEPSAFKRKPETQQGGTWYKETFKSAARPEPACSVSPEIPLSPPLYVLRTYVLQNVLFDVAACLCVHAHTQTHTHTS